MAGDEDQWGGGGLLYGEKPDWEKFQKWAETVPYTMRNPLYHWTHLELQRYFEIDEILNGRTARKIYDVCTEKLQTKEYSVRNLMRKMNVQTICTTDDPVDTLEFHRQLRQDGFEIPILPAFRPDNAMNVDHPERFNHVYQGTGGGDECGDLQL